jgi:hypothetical protein
VEREIGIDLIGEVVPFGTIHYFVVENSSACTCSVSALAVKSIREGPASSENFVVTERTVICIINVKGGKIG